MTNFQQSLMMPLTQKKSGRVEITLSLVSDLIAEQFPQWSHLPLRPVEVSGWDNRTFRLGEEMSIRLPSGPRYALQVQKEQKWLPVLAPHLSFPIPEPLAQGKPSTNYPWNWSIYRWIKGGSANTLTFDDSHLNLLALNLAQFLNELHKIDVRGGPLPGLHNYWRGDHLSVYDADTTATIAQLRGIIDERKAMAVWEKAIKSKWSKDPVWIHGDFASGNILVKDNRLTAVIDFGCMCMGDPACDLVIAWTFFSNESRKIFKSHLCLDPDTWARAGGWALWKATFELAGIKDKTNPTALKQQKIIDEILK